MSQHTGRVGRDLMSGHYAHYLLQLYWREFCVCRQLTGHYVVDKQARKLYKMCGL